MTKICNYYSVVVDMIRAYFETTFDYVSNKQYESTLDEDRGEITIKIKCGYCCINLRVWLGEVSKRFLVNLYVDGRLYEGLIRDLARVVDDLEDIINSYDEVMTISSQRGVK